MSSQNDIRRPVIVQIVPAMNYGGVERGTVEIAQAIVKKGYKAIVISNGGPLEGRLTRLGVVTYRLPVHSKNPFSWPSTRRKLKKILRHEGADIVHLRSRAPAWISLPIIKDLGLKSVATIHSKFTPSNAVKLFYNKKMLSADKVIAISAYVKSIIITYYQKHVEDDDIHIIHRGVDLEIFDPEKVSQARIVSQAELFKLPEEGRVIMLPGRPARWKGHEILIRAVAALGRNDVSLLLLGAGDGQDSYIRKLEKLALTTGLNAQLRIAKSTNDVPAALMLADVVAMPSIVPEPFGRVAIEAQAMGRPVVAFNHGGAIESILNGKTGWLANPDSIEDLTRCLSEALDMDSAQRSVWSARVRAHVKKSFSKRRMCKKTLEIYDQFLQ